MFLTYLPKRSFSLERYILSLTLIFIFLILTLMSASNYLVIREGQTHLLTPEEAMGLKYIDINNDGTLVLQGVSLDLAYLRCFERGHIMGSGSIRATQSIYFDAHSTIDLSQISIELVDITMTISPYSTLILRDYPIKGTGSENKASVDFSPLKDALRDEDGNILYNSGQIVYEDNPNGVTTTLSAPCRQIFKNVKVTGKVVVEEAYPEWFAEEESINTKPLADWSPAINATFDLTANGVVRLQSRRYLVKTTIWVPTRGQLLGTTSGLWNSPHVRYKYDKDTNTFKTIHEFSTVIGTLLQINKDANLTAGCLVLVNYNRAEVEKAAATSNLYNELRNANVDSKFIQTEWVSTGGQISNIYFLNKKYNGEYLSACCILVSGCMSFDNLTIRQFRNAIVWSSHYADQKEVTRCMFPYNTCQSNDDYLLDFNNVGDALVCTGNHFTNQESSKANFIRLRQCFGGTVADNIINGNVLITGCKGINFNSNHLENGGQIVIRKSAVTIANNYFHKGIKPSIRIESDINFDASVINLINNSFMYFANYNYSTLKDGICQSGLIRDICEYDIELRGFVEFPNGNRYEHGPVATINISNTFRCFTSYNNAEYLYPIGISLCKSFNEKSSSKKSDANNESTETEPELIPIENFNKRSQLYSSNSTLNVSNKVVITSPCITMSNLNSASIINLMVNGNVGWVQPQEQQTPKETPVTYYYQFIWDEAKSLATPNGRTRLVPIGTVTPKIGFKDGKYDPDSSKGVLIGLGQNSGFGCTAMLRLFRTSEENGKTVEYVDIPLINCRILYDNGISISGYKWKSIANLGSMQILGSTPSEITYMGEKVLTE